MGKKRHHSKLYSWESNKNNILLFLPSQLLIICIFIFLPCKTVYRHQLQIQIWLISWRLVLKCVGIIRRAVLAIRHTAVETSATSCSNTLPVEHNMLCNTHIRVQRASGKAVNVRTRNTKRSAARNVSGTLIWKRNFSNHCQLTKLDMMRVYNCVHHNTFRGKKNWQGTV